MTSEKKREYIEESEIATYKRLIQEMVDGTENTQLLRQVYTILIRQKRKGKI